LNATIEVCHCKSVHRLLLRVVFLLYSVHICNVIVKVKLPVPLLYVRAMPRMAIPKMTYVVLGGK